jgi:hypothetical protein
LLSQNYQAIEYEESTRQWYFIRQDTRTGNWIASQPVPSSYQLGRESIQQSMSEAINVDNSQAGHTQSPLQDHQSNCMATTTQTMASTRIDRAALTLVGTSAPMSTPFFHGFGTKPGTSKTGPPGRGYEAFAHHPRVRSWLYTVGWA